MAQLTVSSLRKAMKNLKGSTPVYISDHDHSQYEVNGRAGTARLLNQKNADPREGKSEQEIKGDYFVIRVG